jgi:drug/metabolite transporter (DMT)-like permease
MRGFHLESHGGFRVGDELQVLLSSVTPVVKYIFQRSTIQPIGLAYFRVVVGFLPLLALTWLCDRGGLMSLTTGDLIRLGCVSFLGVFSYAIAAWGLMHTSVIHYAFIYGLLPSCTAMLSVLVGKDRMTGPKCAGTVLSLAGCVVAISRVTPFNAAIQFGDLFVLLFTVMMSAHIVFTSGMVKRFGVMASNTEPQILSWRFLPWAKTSLSSLESSKNPS